MNAIVKMLEMLGTFSAY